MRIEIRQAAALECVSENAADRRGVAPVLALQADGLELPVFVLDYLGAGKQWVVWPPQLLLLEVGHPFLNDPASVIADREEHRHEGLGILGAHFAGVLMNRTPMNIDVLHLE